MTESASSRAAARTRAARLFVAGAGVGFAAGAFAVSTVVWTYGNVIGSRAAGQAHPPLMPAAVDRFVAGLDAAGDAVVAGVPAVTGTSGEPSPVVRPSASPEPTIGPASTELERRDLAIPVQGVRPDQLTRSFADRRGGNRTHEAIDILAPMDTPVIAVEDGRIARLFYSKAGGITIYQFDPSERFSYYYAHLSRYADGLREGQEVRKGQVIGYVGISGNAPKDTPHLHFAVFRLTEAKRWWEGTPLDPYDVLR